MADETVKKLIQGGVRAVQNGQLDLARQAFLAVVKRDPENEAGWIGLASASTDKKEKLRCLRKALQLNPQNEAARAAVQRMGIDPAQLVPSSVERVGADAPATPEDSAEDPASLIDSADFLNAQTAFVGADDDGGGVFDYESGDAGDALPPLAPPDLDELPAIEIQPSAEERAEAGETPVAPAKRLRSLIDTEMEDSTAEKPPRKTAVDVLARAPRPLQGQNGLPVPDGQHVQRLAERAKALVRRYEEDAQASYAGVNWTEKKRGRAGEGDYRNFLIAVSSSVSMVLLLFIGFGVLQFVQSEAGQELLFAPTFTPTFTPTVTPTATPGFTNTPSPTPEFSPSPTPTLRPTITPGNPSLLFAPEPTDVPYPQGVRAEDAVNEAAALIEQGRLQEAEEILQAERVLVLSTGDFVPFYYLTLLELERGNIAAAEAIAEDGRERWERSSDVEQLSALVNIAFAQIDMARARTMTNPDRREELLENAEMLLNAVAVELNPEFPDAFDRFYPTTYLVLSQLYLLQGREDDALAIIEQPLENIPRLYANTTLRLRRAQLLQARERYDEALQAVREILVINPYAEGALAAQVEMALAADQPGDAVLAAEEYLFYYPGDVRGYYLLGQAREAENKFDLALNAYSRALGGDENDPFYEQALLARADVYVRIGLPSEALADYTRALSLVSTDRDMIRAERMQAALQTGNYTLASQDAAALRGSSVVAEGERLLVEARVLVERDENYEAALNPLIQARTLGISEDLEPILEETLARAHLELGNFDAALIAIERALTIGARTGQRVYLRAQIYDALEETTLALRDYEFVLTWGPYYDYPFLDAATVRYRALQEQMAAEA